MTNFLLEIGTEEMPAHFTSQVIDQLSENVLSDFENLRLQHARIHCTSTPRRIVLLVEEIADLAADLVKEFKGPPLNQAFINATPTSAANGFAKRFGLEPADLEIRETSKGKFVFATTREKGRSTYDLLQQLIPNWISNLQGKRFMRWGDGERRFSRPIRWMVALLDSELIPVKLDGCDPILKVNKRTRGLRFKDINIPILSVNDYFKKLGDAGIIVNREERKSVVLELINQESKVHNCIPDIPSQLLDELTDLVEKPSLFSGEFDSSFLQLPPEVLTTVMKVHQRYVPLYVKDKDKIDPLSLGSEDVLLPLFFCVSNCLDESIHRIKIGNERVLRARLSDARFFVKSDLSISSLDRLDRLKEVSFSNELGSLFDRVKRIEWIVKLLIENINGPILNKENTIRAALLCKHDLVSQMVGEFPELEGIIGGKYLLYEKEPREVALAVLEHYFPRGSADSIPKSDAGSILALAERFELLLSIFSKGDRPTGSSDPYALRRAGNGILRILFSSKWSFNLQEFLVRSIKYWSDLFPEFDIKEQDLFYDLSDFFRQRIISQLEDQKFDSDLVQAVAGQTISFYDLLSDPADVLLRAELLSSLRSSGKLSDLQSVVTRASRLAEKSTLSSDILDSTEVIDSSLFEKKSENEVLNLIKKIEPIAKGESNKRYMDLADVLSEGSNVLANFFDGDQSVMVMTDNLPVRVNRLNLLKILKNQASVLADFNQISG